MRVRVGDNGECELVPTTAKKMSRSGRIATRFAFNW